MRKTSPDGVWEDFENQLDAQLQYYRKSWDNLPDAADRKMATENYALTIGVMFEGFINDLIFAYANRDCSRVMQHLENTINETLASVPKAEAAFKKFADFNQRDHLSKSELKEILDPAGRNTSFPNFAAIEKRATQWLTGQHLDKFTNLSAQERAVIDVVIAIRNNLAHRSKSSLDRLNDTLNAGALYQTGLQRNVRTIKQAGHYLKAISPANGAETRATILGQLLKRTAQQLVL